MALSMKRGKIVKGRYAGVPDDVSTDVIPEKVFSDEEFINMNTYSVPLYEEVHETRAASKLYSLLYTNRNLSENIPYLILKIALSVRERKAGKGLVSLLMKAEGSLSFSKEVTTFLSDLPTEPEIAQAADVEDVPDDEKEIFGDTQAISSTTETKDYLFAGYMCAYLMRLCVKDPKNIIRSWGKMKENFINFYSSTEISDWPTPTEAHLVQLRNLLSSDTTIMKTWVKAIAEAEHRIAPSDAGLLRYLAILPFSYTGMHAYKLLLTVKKICNFNMQWIMEEMASPETIPALDEIYMILKTYERKDKTRKFYYKYARIVGPEYFQKIQTKNCPALVFLLISIINNKVESRQAHQNPENIVGAQGLTESLRERLRGAAKAIVERAPEQNKESYSETMREFLGKTPQITEDEEFLFGN
ncbi:nucleocapsid protein [paper mulberry mosaic associated virus]|uniref:Nucleoprotein n=1 Tax=paper mulberry mosaic associated virus TaxID=3071215 RepID=A0AAE7JKT3_9RHAB|nr:nucleocapsid protein [paper mulberry mosaic associated virus]QNO38990.1 nucleocapsid protein [paper mulberry mosaic associated virus]